jgi:hypothetical protein
MGLIGKRVGEEECKCNRLDKSWVRSFDCKCNCLLLPPMPATSPTLSPTLSAMVAGLRGESSGMPAIT